MQLIQYHVPEIGRTVGLVADGRISELAGWASMLDLVGESSRRGVPIGELVVRSPQLASGWTLADLEVSPRSDVPHLLLPIDPPEVWGAGITYERTATRYDEGAAETIYTRVYGSERPELFFKSTAARCVGPNQPIVIRGDSTQTSTEPELAALLGPEGEVLALLCCNDVTARDIEYENPLYLPQAKIYAGSCALGPALTTLDAVSDPHALEIACTIVRGAERWQGSTNTARMKRRLEELASWLTRHNPLPLGTVLTTGTGIVPPVEWCLREGDVVTIEIEGVGRLSNPVRRAGTAST